MIAPTELGRSSHIWYQQNAREMKALVADSAPRIDGPLANQSSEVGVEGALPPPEVAALE